MLPRSLLHRHRVTRSPKNASTSLDLWWNKLEHDQPSFEMLSSCTTILLNIGHWPAGWPEGVPWTLEQYSERVTALITWAHALATTQGAKVAWLSSVPFPLNAGGGVYKGRSKKPVDLTHCPPTDWRFPHVLHAYNRAAREAAAQLSIDYIDLWQMTLDVFELSADTMHFDQPVGDAHVDEVLRWILGSSCARYCAP